MLWVLAALIGLVAAAAAAGRQELRVSEADRAAIERAALDYGEGWYEGDADRMQRALHPELAKRMVYTDPRTGRSRLDQQGALTLIENTRRGGGKSVQASDPTSRVVILDVFENAASAKVVGPQWVDYLHLARWEGRWVIVNVLWELDPS